MDCFQAESCRPAQDKKKESTDGRAVFNSFFGADTVAELRICILALCSTNYFWSVQGKVNIEDEQHP